MSLDKLVKLTKSGPRGNAPGRPLHTSLTATPGIGVKIPQLRQTSRMFNCLDFGEAAAEPTRFERLRRSQPLHSAPAALHAGGEGNHSAADEGEDADGCHEPKIELGPVQ